MNAGPSWFCVTSTPTASTGSARTRAAAGPASVTSPVWAPGGPCASTRWPQVALLTLLAEAGRLSRCGLSAGFGSGLLAETKGVYVLFFLLSSLLLMLLAAAGLLYHRHRRGAFQVHCQYPSTLGPHHNRKQDDCVHAQRELPPLPPPPPPARGFRESWPRVKECCPAVELPLLRFSPLVMDGHKEPKQRGKI